MKLHFKDVGKLQRGIKELSCELGFTISEREDADVVVQAIMDEGEIVSVNAQPGLATIRYGSDSARFFRGLGILIEELKEGNDNISRSETPLFIHNGGMLDVSRNAVMRPETIKFMIRRMALMGLNTLMLYTEDTYEIEDRPYFGYMRGRYTKEEIKDIDSYALLFGIELIPCVQFLAHLTTALRWRCAAPYKDMPNILLVGEEETYKLIDDMLKSISECFTTKRLHMGMDEAHALGRGQYLVRNGYRDQIDIFLEHLDKITEMAKGYGFEPMMWSDMFFSMLAPGKADYDLGVEFDHSIKENVPEGVRQIFWDYYNDSKDFYTINIDKHKCLGDDTIFAGGIWAWVGGSVVYDLTLQNTLPALNACKEKGIKDVFATIWHNGAESNLILSLAGLQIFAEFDYSGEYDEGSVAKRFNACCNANYEDFLALSKVEEPRLKLKADNASRYLLYNDPLIGLFDKHVKELDIGDHYEKLREDFEDRGPTDGPIKPAFDVIRKLIAVLELKADFGVRLKGAYDKKDVKTLKDMKDECLEIMKRLDALRISHRQAWMLYNKPFGWETLEARYGALYARFSTTKERIGAFIQGDIDSIEELEAERLSYDCDIKRAGTGKFGAGWGTFTQIYTAGIL